MSLLSKDVFFSPVLDLARAIKTHELSPTELVTAFLERIDTLNPTLNAFVITDPERALAQARSLEAEYPDLRPFAGVPIAIKDYRVAVDGLRLTNGSLLFGNYTPDYDSYIIRRLRNAGFVIVGRTNTPEFAILGITEPKRYGKSLNPWDYSRTCGGSSGGSAVAVAAGLVPVAHGSDGGGSIRGPAACCGIVGHKPSRGRISPGPELGGSYLFTEGFLNRTVTDAACLLDVVSGVEIGDSWWSPPCGESFFDSLQKEVPSLRVGILTDSLMDFPVDSRNIDAVQKSAEIFQSHGHLITEVGLPHLSKHLFETFLDVWCVGVAQTLRVGEMLSGIIAGPETIENLTSMMADRGANLDAPSYAEALDELQRLERKWAQALVDVDILISPVLSSRPFCVGEVETGIRDWEIVIKNFAQGQFMFFANVGGQPSISIPVGIADDGLPLSVQITGKPSRDDVVLLAAHFLESENIVGNLRPPRYSG